MFLHDTLHLIVVGSLPDFPIKLRKAANYRYQKPITSQNILPNANTIPRMAGSRTPTSHMILLADEGEDVELGETEEVVGTAEVEDKGIEWVEVDVRPEDEEVVVATRGDVLFVVAIRSIVVEETVALGPGPPDAMELDGHCSAV